MLVTEAMPTAPRRLSSQDLQERSRRMTAKKTTNRYATVGMPDVMTSLSLSGLAGTTTVPSGAMTGNNYATRLQREKQDKPARTIRRG
jgi:hypothetical protein